MARPSSFPGRAAFRQWLEADRLVSPSTARSYAVCVGTLLRQLPDDSLTEGTLTTLFDTLRHKSGYANYRTAWRAFSEWALTQGVRIALPRKGRPPAPSAQLPEEALRLADRLVRAGISVSALQVLKHWMVEPARDPNFYSVLNPSQRHMYAMVSTSAARSWLELWPPEDKNTLLFPETQGSETAYPTKAFRNALKAFRSEQETQERLEALGGNLTPCDGSAVGGPLPEVEKPVEESAEGLSSLPAEYRDSILRDQEAARRSSGEDDGPSDVPELAESLAFNPDEDKLRGEV